MAPPLCISNSLQYKSFHSLAIGGQFQECRKLCGDCGPGALAARGGESRPAQQTRGVIPVPQEHSADARDEPGRSQSHCGRS